MGELRSTIVERHYDDLRSHDLDRMRQLFRDDVVTVFPGTGELKGVEAFIEYATVFLRAIPDTRVEIRTVVEQGNTVIAEGTLTGTHTGPLATPDGREIPPTGKRVEFATADAFDVEDGKVTGHRVYFDQMELMTQLGLIPEPTAASA
jgi:steroid delta-isomerase-like uncharacterized protein